MLTIPPYISSALEREIFNDYEWDDDDPEETYQKEDERLGHAINQCAERAVVALALGFAEWVAWRLRRCPKSRILLQFIEALWAATIDRNYLGEYEIPEPDEWTGPELGPLWATFDLLDDIFDLVSTDQFCYPETVSISQLALHILPDAESFKRWRRFAINRLKKAHPARREDFLGLPAPRQALNPDLPYTPGDAPLLLSEFLAGLDPRENPYLATPEQMKASGFAGTPYQYDQQGG